MRILKEIFGKTGVLSTVLSMVVCLVFFGMMIMTVLDVILRYLFNSPLLGAFEITEFMMVVIVFFSLAYTQSQKGHVTVDFFVTRLSEQKRRVINLISHSIYFLLILTITWKSVARAIEILETKEVSGTLSIPVFPFYLIVALGCAAMCIELLRDISKIMRQIRS